MEESRDFSSEPLAQTENETEHDISTEDTEMTTEVSHNTASNSLKSHQAPNLNKPVKHLKLPFSKIKQIMKMDPDVAIIQQDAVFLVGKATELFIEYLTRETYKQLVNSKRKTVMKRDVDLTIETIPQLCFLDGALE